MLKNILIVAGAFCLLTACNNAARKAADNKVVATPAVAAQFGAPITADNAISYEALLKEMTKKDSVQTKVTGKVSAVCMKKGCWMTMVSDQPNQPPMRVTFKDYAFFMPKDIPGKQVVLQGFAKVETTPIDVLRHFAEDAGKTKAEIDAITQPKREMTFEAAGVVILK
jgi:Domain of unknown function (DUF4920)